MRPTRPNRQRWRAARWWQGPDRLIAIYRGEARHFDDPALAVARIYDGVNPDGWKD